METLSRPEVVKAAILHLRLKIKGSLDHPSTNIAVHCPFHKDNSPSLYIHSKEGVFRCFSCKRQGNIETLFRELTGSDLYETLDISKTDFADFATRPSAPPNLDELDKDVFINLSGTILPFVSSPAVMRYLRTRGISSATAASMGFRYAEDAYINKTHFKERLLIPIYEAGKLISVEGRDITKTAPIKVLYPKGSSVNTLFQLDKLDRHKPLYAVEGLIDLALLRPYKELENSTSIFGAALTPRQIHLLRKFDEVIYIPDNDRAGDDTVKTFRDNKMLNVKILKLPSVMNNVPIKDVGDLVKAQTSVGYLIQRKWLLRARRVLN